MLDATEQASRLGPGDQLLGPALARHSIYTASSVFEEEMRNLHGRAWNYLGHECQIPQSGNYFLAHVGQRPVIVTRDAKQTIQVLENRCAHRGPAVCTEPSGTHRAFVCPYHGWRYGLDGRLLSLPLPNDYGASFPRGSRGLRAAAKVGSYRGFIFATFAEDAPELLDFLGEACVAFDNFVDRSPAGALELAGPPLRHRIRANWKLVFENLNDVIHPLFAHASVGAAGRSMEDAKGAARTLAQDPARILEAFTTISTRTTRFGHSFQPGLAKLVGVGAASRDDHLSALAEVKGEAAAREILDADIYVAMIYPTVLVKPGSQNIRVIRPITSNETEVSSYFYRLIGAPDSVLTEAYEYFYSLASPASPVLSDDLHVYELIQNDYHCDDKVSMERGWNPASPDASSSSGTSEAYIRGQYRTWTSYMSGQWP